MYSPRLVPLKSFEPELTATICQNGFRRLDVCAALIAGLSFLAPAHAQSQKASAQQAQPDQAGELKRHEEELKALRDAQQKSADTEAALKREIEQIGADRRKLNDDLIATAAHVRDIEAEVTETERRLRPLDVRENAIRGSLEGRRSAIGEVLAALQRIGRRPPPALIASPEDALQAVRTAIVLGAVLPNMRAEVDTLARELLTLVTVRKQIAESRDKLKKELADLETQRSRMNALVSERQKQQAERENALLSERARARELAQKSGDLKDLIAKLEQTVDAATRAAREIGPGTERPSLAALHDPGRLAPAVAFASLRGHIPVPVNGMKLKAFGDADGIGGSEKGVSVATRAGAQVTAPADGWVVYAGPFRSYGQLLILNVGGGYHLLLAGMDRISVDLGQFVLTGEPVAVMGSGSQTAGLLAAGSSQPVLYIELRKDGVPVDPGPWWAAGEGEKVRG
jgi:septal ring factor EnvC (AmiA/AmiB activator)